MSFDKLIAAATDYFSTGAEVHRRALAGGGGKITDMSGGVAPTETVTDVAPKKKTMKVVEPAPAPAAETTVAPAAEATVAPAAEATVAPEDDLDGAPSISYEEDIRPVLRAKSLANRDALVALLGKFNVKSGQELTADQYPAFLAGLKAI